MKLSLDFFQNENVLEISKNLLGKKIFTNIDNQIAAGIIIETEAYGGATDKACHSYNNKKTNRTEVMFQNGGITYIYLCYGMHHLLNIVTNKKNIPEAILIRAILPTDGIEIMLKRKGKKRKDKTLTNGPGSVCKALGINMNHNKLSLSENTIWVENISQNILEKDILKTPRIGIDYAGEDACLPWRFLLKNI